MLYFCIVFMYKLLRNYNYKMRPFNVNRSQQSVSGTNLFIPLFYACRDFLYIEEIYRKVFLISFLHAVNVLFSCKKEPVASAPKLCMYYVTALANIPKPMS